MLIKQIHGTVSSGVPSRACSPIYGGRMKNHLCDQQEGDEGSIKFPVSLFPGLRTGAWGDMKQKRKHSRGAVLFLVGHVVR